MKNKIISILCIIVLLSFVFINSTFAFTVNKTDGGTVTVPDFSQGNPYCYYFYYDSDSNWATVVASFVDGSYFVNTEIVEYTTGNYYKIKCYDKNDNEIKFYKFGCSLGASSWRDNLNISFDPLFCSKLEDSSHKFSSSHIIYNADGSILFGNEPEPIIIYPGISNTAEDLATGTFDYILVAPGTFNNAENIGLNIYNITNLEDGEDVYSRKPIFSTTLNSSSSFYNSISVEDQTEFWYEIPRSNLNIDFKNDNTYLYSLLLDGSPIQELQATIGGLTDEDIMNNNFDNLQSTIVESNKELQSSIDKQTEVLEENNKTSKNIFEKIGEILSYLNPFSENFFAYKLVELIVDGLKSLFIPGDDFFSLYFDELNNWFSDRLGFLYYPLELLFDLLDRFLNINFSEPIINIPNIKEPFTNVILIKSTSFNFNDLLENETLKNVHDIYFIIVDAFIYIGLVGLLYRKYEEVLTK